MNRPTLMQRINRRLDAHRNGEAGLALLDVLLGMAIFALIAVIAVQAMGQFRERAFVTQATSDAKQIGTGIEAAMTEPNATFAAVFASVTLPTAVNTGVVVDKTTNAAVFTRLGVNMTGSNRFIIKAPATGTINETNYRVCVDNGQASGGKHIIYNSAVGAVAAPGTGPCSLTA